MQEQKRIVIIGGGFGGVKAARSLNRKLGKRAAITLVSESSYFVYHGNLYRVATGKTTAAAVIPLQTIFGHTKVVVAVDTITELDHLGQAALGTSGQRYPYDYVILAAGSVAGASQPVAQTSTFQFKTLHDALALHKHIHAVLSEAVIHAPPDHNRLVRFFVIGAGIGGVELAGELGLYLATILPAHHLAKGTAQVFLIEKTPEILPGFKQTVRAKVAHRLKNLGVQIKTATTIEQILDHPGFVDRSPTIDTAIFTIGVHACDLVTKWHLPHDEKCRINVNDHLQVEGLAEVFAIGDIASVNDSGRAMAALRQADYVASAIDAAIRGVAVGPYQPRTDNAIIPVGTGWAAAVLSKSVVAGRLGWLLRRWFDFAVYHQFLPLTKALALLPYNDEVQEDCVRCMQQLPTDN